MGSHRMHHPHRHPMHGPYGRGMGGPGRRSKMFDAEQFQLLILSLIGEGERHGYELMREIETQTGGAYSPSPGVVYPTLTLLTEMGLIAETGAAGARKTFRLTEDGEAWVGERKADAEALLARLDDIGGGADKADSVPVRRAMGNLRHVLMARLTRPGTSDDHLLEAARIIDEAAGQIERLK